MRDDVIGNTKDVNAFKSAMTSSLGLFIRDLLFLPKMDAESVTKAKANIEKNKAIKEFNEIAKKEKEQSNVN